MPTTVYNKLVRDRIPEIILAGGGTPHTRTMDDEECRVQLIRKMDEELQEYVESGSTEELADILEVFLSLAALDGHSYADIDQVRKAKRQKNGGFERKIFLSTVDQSE